MDLLEVFKDSEDVVDFPAGSVIATEGEEGDHMYVLMKGEVTIAVNNRVLATALPGEILGILEKTQRGAGGEIQLTDAIATLLERQQVLAYEFMGTRYDCGSKLGYLEATIDFALKHPELDEDFARYLRQRVESL